MEFEIIIPEQYEELLEKKAAEQGITVEELLESAIRKFFRKEERNEWQLKERKDLLSNSPLTFTQRLSST